MNREEWRDPTADEIRVLRRMLSVDFPGCEDYKSQLLGLKVAPDTTNGTTLFLLPDETTSSAAPTDRAGLTDGLYDDSDGTKVELHLVAGRGRLRFLDTMKLDPVKEALTIFPPDEKIVVRVSPAPISTPAKGCETTPKISRRFSFADGLIVGSGLLIVIVAADLASNLRSCSSFGAAISGTTNEIVLDLFIFAPGILLLLARRPLNALPTIDR